MAKILLALSALAVVVFASFVQDPQDDMDTVLSQNMKAVNKAYRVLRSSLKKPARDAESLEKLHEITVRVLAAKIEKPHMLPKVPEADRQQFLIDFRKVLIALIKLTLDIEVAVLEGRRDDARNLLKDLNRMKSPAHKKYRIEKDG